MFFAVYTVAQLYVTCQRLSLHKDVIWASFSLRLQCIQSVKHSFKAHTFVQLYAHIHAQVKLSIILHTNTLCLTDKHALSDTAVFLARLHNRLCV